VNENHLQHYENFPVASWLCPPGFRSPITAIYRFARMADDLADEGDVPAEARLDKLEQLRQSLLQAVSGSHNAAQSDPVCGPLAQSIQAFHLPVYLFADLLDAFTQDVLFTRDLRRYATFEELLAYCSKSANPIGRLLLHLYDIQDPRSLAQSDQICTSLQLINFWQDLSVDLPRNRHYLPESVLAQFTLDRATLQLGRDTSATRAAIRYCANHARSMMLQGAPLAKTIPGRAGWELRMVVQGGLRILDRIEAMNFSTLSARPSLRKADVLAMLWRGLWM
jgi:hydroxysqualene synthase